MATEGEMRALEIAASEARTDTKIARIEGKIDTLVATISRKIDALAKEVESSRTEAHENRRSIIVTIVGSAFALAAFLIAVMVYGDSIFSRGMNMRDMVQSVTKDVLEQQRRAL